MCTLPVPEIPSCRNEQTRAIPQLSPLFGAETGNLGPTGLYRIQRAATLIFAVAEPITRTVDQKLRRMTVAA
jgi:hypothetical protein